MIHSQVYIEGYYQCDMCIGSYVPLKHVGNYDPLTNTRVEIVSLQTPNCVGNVTTKKSIGTVLLYCL